MYVLVIRYLYILPNDLHNSIVALYLHTKLLQYYWPYFLCWRLLYTVGKRVPESRLNVVSAAVRAIFSHIIKIPERVDLGGWLSYSAVSKHWEGAAAIFWVGKSKREREASFCSLRGKELSKKTLYLVPLMSLDPARSHGCQWIKTSWKVSFWHVQSLFTIDPGSTSREM